MALSRYGVVGNLTGYSTFFSEGGSRPEDIINAVANKNVDLAIAWGPLAGYFGKKSATPLVLHPLPEKDSLSDTPFRYSIGLAVRRRDRELRDSLQSFLNRHQSDIQALLKEYSIPTFPIPADKKEGEKTTSAEKPKPAPDSAKVAGRQ
jgi:mxaJ protein